MLQQSLCHKSCLASQKPVQFSFIGHTTGSTPLFTKATGMEVYTNVPERWHITVFHTSQFDDTRPHPLKPVEPDLQRSEPAQHVMPTSANLQQEQETVQMVVSKSQPLVLEVWDKLPLLFLCLDQMQPGNLATLTLQQTTALVSLMLLLARERWAGMAGRSVCTTAPCGQTRDLAGSSHAYDLWLGCIGMLVHVVHPPAILAHTCVFNTFKLTDSALRMCSFLAARSSSAASWQKG